MNFKDLPEQDRLRLKEQAKTETLIALWSEIPTSSSSSWSNRSEIAARILGSIQSVTDVGCGHMSLERYLPAGTKYTPVDCVRRDERTVVVDLNRDRYPPLDTEAATLLGLLEYVHDAQKLVTEVAARHRIIVVTYNLAGRPRSSHGSTLNTWVNAFTESEIEAIFEVAGLEIEAHQQISDAEDIWRLRSKTVCQP